jgi:hypothetical protein
VSEVVIKTLSKHKKELDSELFKQLAKKVFNETDSIVYYGDCG